MEAQPIKQALDSTTAKVSGVVGGPSAIIWGEYLAVSIQVLTVFYLSALTINQFVLMWDKWRNRASKKR